MPVRFVCLANSYKEGGRCVAGITLDQRNNPIIERGLPKWVRPVSDAGHGEISTNLVAHLNLLDIVEIKVKEDAGEGYQCENVTFRGDSIRQVGTFQLERLKSLCDERPTLFGTTSASIHEKHIHRLNHSLVLVRTIEFEMYEKDSEYTPGKKSLRLSFSYKNYHYDLPITDPRGLSKINFNNSVTYLDGVKEIFLKLSVCSL